MKLILIRHPQTFWNLEHRVQGQSDIPLSETGRLQAEAIGKALQGEKIEAVYSSPLIRARNTAEEVGRLHGLEVKSIDGLKEVNAGSLNGMVATEIRARFPDFYTAWKTNAATVRMPGGESLPELQERVWESISLILNNRHAGSAAVVSHLFALRSLFCRALDLELSKFWKFGMDLGGISVLEFSESTVKLVSFNDVCHLEKRSLPVSGSHPLM